MAAIPHMESVRLPAGSSAPVTARRRVEDCLAERPRETVFAAQLVVSELVTHLMRHGMQPEELAVEIDDVACALRLSVGPLTRSPTEDLVDPDADEWTRKILDTVADRWGFDGESAWAELYRPVQV